MTHLCICIKPFAFGSQAITKTRADLLWIGPLGKTCYWNTLRVNYNKNTKTIFRRNAFEDVVCQYWAIWIRPQYGKRVNHEFIWQKIWVYCVMANVMQLMANVKLQVYWGRPVTHWYPREIWDAKLDRNRETIVPWRSSQSDSPGDGMPNVTTQLGIWPN